MKKNLILILICAIFVVMPAIGSIPCEIKESNKQLIKSEQKATLLKPTVDDYDGTILGGIGVIFKKNDEWGYEVSSYLAGVYKDNSNHKTIYCNIYNLEEEQIGTLIAFCSRSIIIGSIRNMDEGKAPIIGFLFFNDENFAGRIMSLFGPAPHIWGKYTPN